MEFVIDDQAAPWTETPRPERRGMGFFEKKLADGKEGRPFAVFGRQPEGFLNPAHFHTGPQFFVLLQGSADFPQHPLKPIAVHYADANTPYGPFKIGPGFMTTVVRSREAGQIYMTDAEGRKRRNPLGREFFAQSDMAGWEELAGDARGVQRKSLLGQDDNQPRAEIYKYPPGLAVHRGPAPFGQFHIVLEGSANVDGRPLGPYSMLFGRGDRWGTVLTAAGDGVVLLSLTFDRD